MSERTPEPEFVLCRHPPVVLYFPVYWNDDNDGVDGLNHTDFVIHSLLDNRQEI
jgi:hypothetical protein